MSYQVTFNPKLRIVEVLKSGMIHYGDLRASGRDAERLSREHNVRRFLCDASAVESDCPISVLSFAKAYAESGIAKTFDKFGMCKMNIMAIVLSTDFPDDHCIPVGEAVNTEWGFIVKRFETKKAAVSWLKIT
jgi:hypothetical protein